MLAVRTRLELVSSTSVDEMTGMYYYAILSQRRGDVIGRVDELVDGLIVEAFYSLLLDDGLALGGVLL